MDVSEYVPDGLSSVQYGMHILQEILAWPSVRSNVDLMSECLISIEKAKRLSTVQAYKYMVRAIKLAKEQNIDVDQGFFRNGEYSKVRPQSKTVSSAGCDPECRNRHGRGYHMNDIQWLMRLYTSRMSSLPNRQMTDYEIDQLLSELDSKRAAGAPDWRR